jgi:cell division protein FtsW
MRYIKRWWRSIDKNTIFAILALTTIGISLIITISFPTTQKISVPALHIVLKQLIYSLLGITAMIYLSCLSEKSIKIISVLGFLLSIILTILVIFYGKEVKGARRWINYSGISIQPSEFLKIFLLPVNALLLTFSLDKRKLFLIIAGVIFIISIILVGMQPDVGTSILIIASISLQYFLSGLPIALITALCLVLLSFMSLAYIFFSHVSTRINNFLNANLSYQVDKALLCFKKGKIFGVGPGEGSIKQYLPDAHTDFIFAAAAEEMGILFCTVIISIFAFLVARNCFKALQANSTFQKLSIAGITFLIGGQTLINVAVNINLSPAKGMCLPFISYGGSSVLSSYIGVGIILALTKKYHPGNKQYCQSDGLR